jgi:PBP1b-binding outer membrane lipoprotein LpoB
MKKSITIGFLSILLTLAGCESAPKVQRVNPDSNKMVATLNKMDLQDWKALSNTMVSELLDSGVLDSAQQKPALIYVTRVRNETMSSQDIEILTNEMISALTNTGKVVASATYGKGAGVADKGTRDIQNDRAGTQDLVDEMNGEYDAQKAVEKTMNNTPYFTLSGSIKQQMSQDSNVKQTAFVLFLRLSETESGRQVWSAQIPIVKQMKKHALGL